MLLTIPEVTYCEPTGKEGGADLDISFRDADLISIECKNVARHRDASGRAKLDFQRTRVSRASPCSRYYDENDFDVVAACLHSVSGEWNFSFVLPGELPLHAKCPGKVGSNVRIDQRWTPNAVEVITRAYARKGIRV
jgi:hypothetical protein